MEHSREVQSVPSTSNQVSSPLYNFMQQGDLGQDLTDEPEPSHTVKPCRATEANIIRTTATIGSVDTMEDNLLHILTRNNKCRLPTYCFY